MMRFIFPLLLVGIAGFIFFTFTEPIMKHTDELRAEQAKLNTALDNAKKLRAVQTALLNTYNNFAPADIERLNKLLPDNVDNVRLIIDINNIAKNSGMTIKGLRLKTEEGETAGEAIQNPSGDKEGAVILGFSVSGPYSNFLAFMNDLSRSLRLVDVTSVTFNSNERGIYDYSVEIRTYWLR